LCGPFPQPDAGLCGNSAGHPARIVTEISTQTPVPIIAGGLLRDKADVLAAMRAGAAAVSTSAPSLWDA